LYSSHSGPGAALVDIAAIILVAKVNGGQKHTVSFSLDLQQARWNEAEASCSEVEAKARFSGLEAKALTRN